MENAQFSQISGEMKILIFLKFQNLTVSASKRCKYWKIHSLPKFHVKCRISLENTVSASERCKEWKMLSLAKFQVKWRFSLQNTVSASKTC